VTEEIVEHSNQRTVGNAAEHHLAAVRLDVGRQGVGTIPVGYRSFGIVCDGVARTPQRNDVETSRRRRSQHHADDIVEVSVALRPRRPNRSRCTRLHQAPGTVVLAQVQHHVRMRHRCHIHGVMPDDDDCKGRAPFVDAVHNVLQRGSLDQHGWRTGVPVLRDSVALLHW
jgi:hypothetical protein